MLDTIKNIEMFQDLNIWEFTRELEAIEKITLKGEQDMETKTKNRRARFEFYREKRVSNAVRAIKLCQNMANKNSYDYSAEEGQKIVSEKSKVNPKSVYGKTKLLAEKQIILFCNKMKIR